jgi:hypothetical protein
MAKEYNMLKITDLSKTKVLELTKEIRLCNDKTAVTLHKTLIEIRKEADATWNPECPIHYVFYDRLNGLIEDIRGKMLALYITRKHK